MANRKSFFNILTFIIFHPFAFAQWEGDTTAGELRYFGKRKHVALQR